MKSRTVVCMTKMPQTSPNLAGNPFAEPSTLPYQMPDFDVITHEHFMPAVEAGVAEARETLRTVAQDSSPVSWDNVMQPLLDASPLLTRAVKTYYHLAGADGTDEISALEGPISGMLSELEDAQYLDPDVFARVDALHKAVHDGSAAASLSPDQLTLLDKEHKRFLLRGAALSEEQRSELAALNQEISALQTEFSQGVLKDMKAASVHLTEESELDGLDAAQKDAAREAAHAAGKDGWLLTLILPTVQPAMSSLTNREVRRRLHEASTQRGTETWNLAAKIAAKRAQKAQMLGFADFASLAVADRDAAKPENVEALFAQAVAPAHANASAEVERIAERARKDGIEDLQPWDVEFYAEKVRAESYGVDSSQLRQYFSLERTLVDGVFHAAHEAYGLSFSERHDVTPPHPDARVWEVFAEDGSTVGLFIGDFYTRDTKRGGAWMNTLVDQSHREGTKPIVMNTLNLSKPAPGEQAHLTLDEVTTLFHEFGHALHALLSNVDQASAAGTAVARDVVEFPSQVNEMWILRKEMLEHYARRLSDDATIPAELIQAVTDAALWGEGMATLEYLAAAELDWRWHRLSPEEAAAVSDPHVFENDALTAAGAKHPLLQPRYRTGYFNHTFSGGYASGYYSYFWAEVLDADAVAWFEEQFAAGSSIRTAGQHFAETLLSQGGTAPMAELYRRFRGGDPEVAHLLRRRGLMR